MDENAKKKDGLIDKLISKSVDFIFSKENKIWKMLLIMLIAGFILRFIAALNLDVLADDMVHASQSAGIISSLALSTHSNPPLFYCLTDLSFLTLGYTTLASRFFPLIFGTLIILLSFLITKELTSNEKVALFAAGFTAFSSFLIRNTFSEASLAIFFFSFLGIYLGLLFLKTEKLLFIMLSGMAFGVGTLAKYNAPFFALAFVCYSAIFFKSKKKPIFSKNNIKAIMLFGIIIILFSVPFLAFNYFLYKEKGITDVYFSRIIKTEKSQQLYAGLAGQENSFFDNLTNPETYGGIILFYRPDAILFLFSIIGFFFFVLNKNKKAIVFSAVFLIIPFILQSAGSTLYKHFLFIPIVLSIPAGYGVYNILKAIKQTRVRQFIICMILIAMLINLGNAFGTPPSFSIKSPTSQLKNYINENINENNLIVFDPRIYTARTFWLATPNQFMDIPDFVGYYNTNINIPAQYKKNTDIYIIECATDDCGWGTIKDQPALNESIEAIIPKITSGKSPEKIIKGTKFESNEFFGKKEEYSAYKVYKITIPFVPNLVKEIDKTNSFYFVPYMYRNMNSYIFNYEVNGNINKFIWGFAYLMIFAAIFAAIVSVFFVIYLAYLETH